MRASRVRVRKLNRVLPNLIVKVANRPGMNLSQSCLNRVVNLIQSYLSLVVTSRPGVSLAQSILMWSRRLNWRRSRI